MRTNYSARHVDLLRDIAEAGAKVHQAERDLRAAVHHARSQDVPWEAIAPELGMTPQRAKDEFDTDWGRLGHGL